MIISRHAASTRFHPVEVDGKNCLVCGACVGICPANAMSLDAEKLNFSQERCTGCGKCVQICPVRALQQKAIPQ